MKGYAFYDMNVSKKTCGKKWWTSAYYEPLRKRPSRMHYKLLLRLHRQLYLALIVPGREHRYIHGLLVVQDYYSFDFFTVTQRVNQIN